MVRPIQWHRKQIEKGGGEGEGLDLTKKKEGHTPVLTPMQCVHIRIKLKPGDVAIGSFVSSVYLCIAIYLISLLY